MRSRSLFAKLFPPPRFTELPSVGVDISDSSVKYIMLAPSGSGFHLSSWGDCPVPDGAIVQGEIKDGVALSKILSDISTRCKTPFMRVSLPEEHAYLFQTKVPADASRAEIRGALEFHLEENVPLSPRDAFFDFEYVGGHEHVGERQKERDVIVTVYAREAVRTYLEACHQAAVVPVSFEIEPEAIARAVMREGNESTKLILDFGKSRTGIGVAHAGVLMFTSTVDVGGKELDTSLLLAYPGAETGELIRLKNECGLFSSREDTKTRDALMKPILALKQEVAARISYWNSKPNVTPIEEIVLCGGIANLAGLPEFFTEELDVATVQADIWQNVFVTKNIVPPITKRYSFGYATAVGLALGAFTEII